jgi:hypothetical protein
MTRDPPPFLLTIYHSAIDIRSLSLDIWSLIFDHQEVQAEKASLFLLKRSCQVVMQCYQCSTNLIKSTVLVLDSNGPRASLPKMTSSYLSVMCHDTCMCQNQAKQNVCCFSLCIFIFMYTVRKHVGIQSGQLVHN